MLNHIVIMGRMVRDPELRKTQSGTSVASFTLAVDRDSASEGAEKETDFIDCVAWKGTADFASGYFFKGSMAVVDGRLQLRDWKDKDGNDRKSVEVVADSVEFADGKDQGAGSYAADQMAAAADQQFTEVEDDDGELPF